MAGKMYEYFTGTVTADYTATELSIKPQVVLSQAAKWKQNVHEMDDGSHVVVTLNSQIKYEVRIQFPVLLATDADTIVDLHSDTNKCKGSAKTFYWQHPTDSHTYVARFAPEMERQIACIHSISEIVLWIEGVKA